MVLLANIDILSAISIDYKDTEEICGYQLLLCKMFEREGGFQYPPVSNRITAAIKNEGKFWLREVTNLINSVLDAPIPGGTDSPNLGDIPRILGAYDFFYRVCNGSPCFDYIRETTLKAVNRYVKGDKSLSQARAALMLKMEADRDIRTMEKRFLNFSGKVMESWIDNLERTGRMSQVSGSDSYEVLRYLLYSDLFAFGIKRNSKLRWIDTYSLSDEQLNQLDTKTLWQYIGFDQAAASVSGASLEEQDARYVYLFTKLASREDLHPFFKEGLAIDLAKYQTI
ncbi:MAG: hypothetical protein NC453_20160 [Muribaculum sp.]|nr:hypothetical protein [Muribaculum sp.]